MLRLLFRLGILLCVTAIAVGVWAFVELHDPFGEFPEPITFEYLPGTTSQATAVALEELGVVESRWHFLGARALNREEVLMAGEYEFAIAESPLDIIARLAGGDVMLRTLTIPEGLTRFETAKLIAEAGYAEEEEFLALTADSSAIRDIAPDAETLEGFLFPETYSLSKTTSGEQLIEAMLANFRTAFAAANEDAGAELAPLEVITLASLIEKETGVAAERPLVSAVFHNRLERGMRMQCDPTIIYGLLVEGRYRGDIYASDLIDPHPYNTYVHTGLPPGPIANPGAASLHAALAPADSDYIFFVANPGGEGSHTFSVTLSDHNRAVARFRAGGD